MNSIVSFAAPEAEWYDSVSAGVLCEDCRRHKPTLVLDYFTDRDESDPS